VSLRTNKGVYMDELEKLKSLPEYVPGRDTFTEFKKNGSLSAGGINGLFETEEDREGLRRWKENYDKKHGEGACDRYMEECFKRGTMLHENIENYYQEKPPAHSDDEVGKYLKLQESYHSKFLVDVEPVYIEKILYSKALRMHGIVDCIGYYKGVLSIIDFKFASKEKDEMYITGYRRQVAVYALIIYKETGLLIDQCVVACGSHKNIKKPVVQVFTYKSSQLVKRLIKQLTEIGHFGLDKEQ